MWGDVYREGDLECSRLRGGGSGNDRENRVGGRDTNII